MCTVSTVFSYSLSVQLASNFELPPEWINVERAALVTVHDGVLDVIVGGAVEILRHNLEVKHKNGDQLIINQWGKGWVQKKQKFYPLFSNLSVIRGINTSFPGSCKYLCGARVFQLQLCPGSCYSFSTSQITSLIDGEKHTQLHKLTQVVRWTLN